MEYRFLGQSGLQVPVLSFGTGTFGGQGDFFKKWGQTDTVEARKLVDICLDTGIHLFDTADIYSEGASEKILGEAVKGRRDQVLISTKATFRTGSGPNDVGASRHHLIRACEASLKRLGTDYIDLYLMHEIDSCTPVEETLSTLDILVKSGKVRYIGCSNFSAWQTMKALSVSEKHHWVRYVTYQGYYSLMGREYEWELLPLNHNQGLGLMVWSPLAWGHLTGKIRRNSPPKKGRVAEGGVMSGHSIREEQLYKVIDVLDEISEETGKTIPQIALNWLLDRPTVSTIIMGARSEEQLRENLGAFGWNLDAKHKQKLLHITHTPAPYPYWHQQQFMERNPSLHQADFLAQ